MTESFETTDDELNVGRSDWTLLSEGSRLSCCSCLGELKPKHSLSVGKSSFRSRSRATSHCQNDQTFLVAELETIKLVVTIFVRISVGHNLRNLSSFLHFYSFCVVAGKGTDRTVAHHNIRKGERQMRISYDSYYLVLVAESSL